MPSAPEFVRYNVQPYFFGISIAAAFYTLCAYGIRGIRRCVHQPTLRLGHVAAFAEDIVIWISLCSLIYTIFWMVPVFAPDWCLVPALLSYGMGLGAATWCSTYTVFTWRITTASKAIDVSDLNRMRPWMHVINWGWPLILDSLTYLTGRLKQWDTIASVCWFANDGWSTLTFFTLPLFLTCVVSCTFALMARHHFLKIRKIARTRDVSAATEERSLKFAQSLLLLPLLYILVWAACACVDIPGTFGPVPDWLIILSNITGPLQGFGNFLIIAIVQRDTLFPCCHIKPTPHKESYSLSRLKLENNPALVPPPPGAPVVPQPGQVVSVSVPDDAVGQQQQRVLAMPVKPSPSPGVRSLQAQRAAHQARLQAERDARARADSIAGDDESTGV